jgi:DNA-binding MarR family transcriptional regulator
MVSTRSTSKARASKPLGVTLEFLRRLWAVDHGLAQVSKAMDKAIGVTGPQRLAVRLIGRRPGIGPAELADLLHVGRGAATGLLKRLEQRGCIRRVLDSRDARRWHLHLTTAGRRVDRVNRGTIEARVTTVLQASDPRDVAAAARVLDALVRSLGHSRSRPRPVRRPAVR